MPLALIKPEPVGEAREPRHLPDGDAARVIGMNGPGGGVPAACAVCTGSQRGRNSFRVQPMKAAHGFALALTSGGKAQDGSVCVLRAVAVGEYMRIVRSLVSLVPAV